MTGTRDTLLKRIWRGQDPFLNYPALLYRQDRQGWGSSHPYLTEAIEALRPSVVVEVGVWKGGSTISLASTMKAMNLDAGTSTGFYYNGTTLARPGRKLTPFSV